MTWPGGNVIDFESSANGSARRRGRWRRPSSGERSDLNRLTGYNAFNHRIPGIDLADFVQTELITSGQNTTTQGVCSYGEDAGLSPWSLFILPAGI
jgi:hypothetical protein